MKTLKITMTCVIFFLAAKSYAKCLVEVLDAHHQPLGMSFENNQCQVAMTKCRQYLRDNYLGTGAQCVITQDVVIQ